MDPFTFGDPRDANRAKRSEQTADDLIPFFYLQKNGVNGVSIACSVTIIRNLTIKYTGNVGLNIHRDYRGIQLENVRALSCADESISATKLHERESLIPKLHRTGPHLRRLNRFQ